MSNELAKSTNPRIRRAYAHAVIAKVKSGEVDPQEASKVVEAAENTETHRSTKQRSGFRDALRSAAYPEVTAHAKAMKQEYIATREVLGMPVKPPTPGILDQYRYRLHSQHLAARSALSSKIENGEIEPDKTLPSLISYDLGLHGRTEAVPLMPYDKRGAQLLAKHDLPLDASLDLMTETASNLWYKGDDARIEAMELALGVQLTGDLPPASKNRYVSTAFRAFEGNDFSQSWGHLCLTRTNTTPESPPFYNLASIGPTAVAAAAQHSS